MSKVARLIEQFEPEHYDVMLEVHEAERTFSGTVTISGKTKTATNEIILHSNELTLESARIDGDEATFGSQTKHHEVAFAAGKELSPGAHEITVSFNGTITPSMLGIYASTFTVDGKEKAIVTTQLESNHAREAFPCVDEPAAKATFQLTLRSKKGEVALSNTPVVEQKEDGDYLQTTFEKTPKMSSYLLAFATGDMHSLEGKTKSGISVTSWASAAQPSNFLQYSVDEAVQILDFFEEYFGVPYPLEKCDMVALPDFDAGAMENWGMITYREVAMLADPDNRSISNEQFVSMVIAHELSHMWFGNLVTMEWWDDLWLNESFASLMEHVALDGVHPEWHQWEHYAASDILSTTSRDIHKDIQPISMEVEDPDLIETLFDPGIVYTKGGRLLKMLREHIGDDAFRKGLKQYFEKHAYKNTQREDLWEALGNASGEDVDSLMSAWLNQPGMPIVSVAQDKKELDVSQTRFVVGSDETFSQTWPIPLLANQELDPAILVDKTGSYELTSDAPVVLNTSASGHFITYYEQPKHRAAVYGALADQTIESFARINVLNDVVLLSRKGLLPYTEGLDAIVNLANEPRFPVWAQVARIIGTAQQLTEDSEIAREQLRALRKHLASNQAEKLGFNDVDGDDANTTQMRSILLSMLLGAQDEKALAYAETLLEEAATPEDLPSESRAALLGSLIKAGNMQLADQLVEDYPSVSSDMQLDTISALSSLRSREKAQEVLEAALGPNGFAKPQDVLRVIAIFLRNHYIRDTTWNYMTDNWDWLVETLNESKSFDYLPTYCAGVVSNDEMAKRYREMFEPYAEHKKLKRNIAIGLADIDARVAWRKENEQSVLDWLENFAS